MPSFGVVCPPIPGHLNPVATLGRALQRRGHRVTVFQVPSLEARVHNEGLEFCGLGPDSGDLSAMIDRLGQLQGLGSLRFAVQGACRLANIICTYLPEAVRAAGIDILLVDQNEPAGGSVAEHMRLPFVSVCPSLPLNREPAIPPPFVPWGYSGEWWAQLRNRLGNAATDRLIAPIQKTLNGFRLTWGLRPLRSPDDSFSKLAQLCQMPREFDFPRRHLPAEFHYFGPFLDDRSGGAVSFPFNRLDGRPLVYASFGTLQPGAHDYFARIAQACTSLNAQLVIATGRSVANAERFPGDPIVVGWAPQMELLRRGSLTVTHAGLNTVMQSLACGVPMVAIPMTHDQPAIAARLARTGAGIVLAPKQATVERLRASMQNVLTDSSYRNAASLLRDAIVRSGGVERAADIVEECWRKSRASHAPGDN